MKTYNELIKINKQERFGEILSYVTNEIKNSAMLDVVKKALLGIQDKEVMSVKETFIISELCAKSYLSLAQSDCLIELSRI